MLDFRTSLRGMLALASMMAAASALDVAGQPTPRRSRGYHDGPYGPTLIGVRQGRGPSFAQSRRAAKKKRNQIRNRRAHRA